MTNRTTVILGVAIVLSLNQDVLWGAHFDATGTPHYAISSTSSIMLQGVCNFDQDFGTGSVMIAADPGESMGDQVQMNYCYTVNASASAAGPGHTAVGGLGGSSATVGCPLSYNNPDPARVLINPGPSQIVIISEGPEEIQAGDPPLMETRCDSVMVRIGDIIQPDGGIFGVVEGPSPSPDTYVTATFSITADLVSPTTIPALNKWGVTALTLFVGFWSLYHLKNRTRRRRYPS